MTVCDLCKKEIVPKTVKPKITLHTEYACSAWKSVELDICNDCRKEVRNTIYQAEAELYQRKIKESENNDR